MKYCENRLLRHFVDNWQPVYFSGVEEGYSLRQGGIDDEHRYIQLDSSGLIYDEDHGLVCDLNSVTGLSDEQIGRRLVRLKRTVNFIKGSLKQDSSFLAIFVKDVDNALAPEIKIFERGFTPVGSIDMTEPPINPVTSAKKQYQP